MALIKRQELAGSINSITRENGPSLFLLFGERFLCRKAADELQQALLDWKSGTVYAINGDQEDLSQTLSKLMSYSLLPGLQVYRVNDSRLFHSKNISETLWQKAGQAQAGNRPRQAVKYIRDMYHIASIAADDRQPLSEMSDEQWQQLFGLSKPTDIGWTDALFNEIQQHTPSSSAPTDLAEKYIASFEKGVPAGTHLILTAENIDKRKRLFTYIKKEGLIIDCSVADGGGAAAQRAQKSVLQELMQETLASFGKTIEPGAVDAFFERVGFHPAAVVNETEKLALYCDDRDTVTLGDLQKMVGRSREDALFELTDHFGKKQLSETLITLNHLLDHGIHGLAILATMRNYIRKLLIFKTIQLQPTPIYQKGMNARQFQEHYLPQLKENQEWKDLLAGHPYAVFMGFAKAAEFSCSTLKFLLGELLQAEYRLKGSGLPERMVLEHLIVALILGKSSSLQETGI